MIGSLLRVIRLLLYGYLIEKGTAEVVEIVLQAKRLFESSVPPQQREDVPAAFDQVLSGSSSTAPPPMSRQGVPVDRGAWGNVEDDLDENFGPEVREIFADRPRRRKRRCPDCECFVCECEL